jgi:membrane protease YdiL (CAAX protease family)
MPGEKMALTPALWIVQLLFQFGFVGLILLYLRVRQYDISSLFGLRRIGFLKAVGTSLLWLIPAYIVIITVTAVALPLMEQLTGIEMKQQMLVERSKEVTDPVSRILMFTTLCIGAPLLEEVIFRGVLFSAAAKYLHPVYANVATSLFFGVIHNNLLSLIPLTLLGMAFAAAWQRTRSLAVPVIMHSILTG